MFRAALGLSDATELIEFATSYRCFVAVRGLGHGLSQAFPQSKRLEVRISSSSTTKKTHHVFISAIPTHAEPMLPAGL